MKLVVAIIQDYDTDAFLKAVTRNGLMATRIASLGGFLRMGNTTVFLAVEDHHVGLVKKLLAEHCRLRTVEPAPVDFPYVEDADFEHIAATRHGGGVAFVARISRFEKIFPAPSDAEVKQETER
jgi:uncharacterized protein YaaQ